MVPISIRSYPRAILHFDGDSFFASVEQALNHTLRGKPVVTGGERGAATSVSYEAKALGIYRGMPLREMRRICPTLNIVASDYTAYSIFARRMYAIVREYTPLVEEYSIDECFADITGREASMRASYADIAIQIKGQLESDLGVTFGVGLAPTKVLAKVASKLHKPAGFMQIPTERIPEVLESLPLGSIWGMGGKSSVHMGKLGITTALQFARQSEGWLMDNHVSKPYREIWHELNGRSVKPLTLDPHAGAGSLMRTRTFTPTRSREQIYSHLAQNVEGVCAKARAHGIQGRTGSFYLKTQTFEYTGGILDFGIAVSDPCAVLQVLEKEFAHAFVDGLEYRATGFTLHGMIAEHAVTQDLFGKARSVARHTGMLQALDAINAKYGKGTIHLGSSLAALHEQPRKSSILRRKKFILDVDQRKKSLNIPYLGIAR